MRFAYADPPYLGQGRHYPQHDEARTWDEPETHRQLVDRLVSEFPDGWAMSLSSPSLATILPMCPDDVRVAAWVKSFAAFKKGVRPAYAWEPVIFRGGRNQHHAAPEKGGVQTTPKDYIIEPITLQKGLVGAKPIRFCRWVLAILNHQDGDELVDLFPGTGVMDRVLAQGQLVV